MEETNNLWDDFLIDEKIYQSHIDKLNIHLKKFNNVRSVGGRGYTAKWLTMYCYYLERLYGEARDRLDVYQIDFASEREIANKHLDNFLYADIFNQGLD